MSSVYPYALPVGTVSGGNWIPTTGLTQLKLRNLTTLTEYNMVTEVSTGVYHFGDVSTPIPYGKYNLYNNTTLLSDFGTIGIGVPGIVYDTGAQTVAGIKTFSEQPVFSSGIKTNTISENTATSGVTIDGILLKDSLDLSNIVTKTGSQTIAGEKTFSDIATFSNTSVFQNDIGASPAIYPQVANSSDQPTLAVHLAPKFYVDAAVSSVNVKPYQQATNIRRVQQPGIVEAGKLYTSIADCITNFGTTSNTARLLILLEQGQADSNYNNIFPLTHAAISTKTHISIIGISRFNTHLLFGLTGDAVGCTAEVTFENMSIYATTQISDRVYGSMEFNNCTIYAYKDINFANCKITNCDIVHANGEIPTLSSGGKCLNTTFSGTVTEDTYTGKAVYSDGYDSSPTMPTAPNLGA